MSKRKKKYKFEFNIDRSRWTENVLAEKDGGKYSYCAIGFLGKELGASASSMYEESSPEAIPKKYHKKLVELGILKCRGGTPVSSDIANKITMANDEYCRHVSDKPKKEAKLKELFGRIGIKVNFVGKFPIAGDEF